MMDTERLPAENRDATSNQVFNEMRFYSQTQKSVSSLDHAVYLQLGVWV